MSVECIKIGTIEVKCCVKLCDLEIKSAENICFKLESLLGDLSRVFACTIRKLSNRFSVSQKTFFLTV